MRRSTARLGAVLAVAGTLGLGVAVGSAEASPRAGVPAALLSAESPVCNGKAPASDRARSALNCAPAPLPTEATVTLLPGTTATVDVGCEGSVLTATGKVVVLSRTAIAGGESVEIRSNDGGDNVTATLSCPIA